MQALDRLLPAVSFAVGPPDHGNARRCCSASAFRRSSGRCWARDAPLNEVLHERLLRLINGHPNETNYFAWQALHRSYAGPGDRCLPPYLQRRQFERMRDGAGLIIPVHANLRQFLENLPAREVDAVILLDSQDWMAPDEIAALWNAIDRTGSDNVRVIFRTAGAGLAAGGRGACGLRQIWRRDEERSAHRF